MFAIFSGLTVPIFVVALAWTLAASVVAVRQALDYSTTRRAVAVCGLAWLLAILITAMFTAVVAASSRPATAERVAPITVVAKDTGRRVAPIRGRSTRHAGAAPLSPAV